MFWLRSSHFCFLFDHQLSNYYGWHSQIGILSCPDLETLATEKEMKMTSSKESHSIDTSSFHCHHHYCWLCSMHLARRIVINELTTLALCDVKSLRPTTIFVKIPIHFLCVSVIDRLVQFLQPGRIPTTNLHKICITNSRNIKFYWIWFLKEIFFGLQLLLWIIGFGAV